MPTLRVHPRARCKAPALSRGVMGHANIATTRRLYAGDWREAEERNAWSCEAVWLQGIQPARGGGRRPSVTNT
jgi:hypothetical protein